MPKSSFVRARIEPDLKYTAEVVLNELGITPTQAITMLYKRLVRDQSWPLELKVPNAVTKKAMEEARKGIGVISCDDLDDLFDQTGM